VTRSLYFWACLFLVVGVVGSFGGVEVFDEGALEDIMKELEWIKLQWGMINGLV
jgi:hypothetical protein